MKKHGILKIVLLLLVLFAAACTYFDYGYLPLASNSFVYQDTINTASANDTSLTFRNQARYKTIWLECYQNGAFMNAQLYYPSLNQLRARYLAADSSIHVESYSSVDGWTNVPLILPGTSLTATSSKITCTLKTGTGLVAFRGSTD